MNRALVQLAAINDDKMHWRLGQQVTRDELHKRLATEQQQLTEIKVKVAQKRAEIDANQTKFDQQLKTKTEQFDAERAQRMWMEDQVAAARDQLTSLQVAFDKSPDQIRAEIDKVRRDKLKHQVQMTTIRARYQTIQKGYADGEGIAEYLERARYSLLHPDTAPEFGAS